MCCLLSNSTTLNRKVNVDVIFPGFYDTKRITFLYSIALETCYRVVPTLQEFTNLSFPNELDNGKWKQMGPTSTIAQDFYVMYELKASMYKILIMMMINTSKDNKLLLHPCSRSMKVTKCKIWHDLRRANSSCCWSCTFLKFCSMPFLFADVLVKLILFCLVLG